MSIADEEHAEELAGVERIGTPSRLRVVAGRFFRSGQGRIGFALLTVMFLLAFAGPHLSKWTYTDKDFTAFLQPPSAEHWWGTLQTGADVYAVTLRGMQKSLIVGLLAAVVGTGLAAVVGAFAGYFLGWTDRTLMWVTDLLLVLPAFLILAIMSPLFAEGQWLLFVLMLALFLWMVTSKIVRSMTISLKEREFIHAARFMGVHPIKIIFRHVIPNLSSLLIVDATLNVSAAILTETSLSYFGFGIQPPDVSMGSLIADGARTAVYAPWTFWFCAGLLVVTVLAVNLVGDSLRDAFDPTAKRNR
ncbi:ABC transporter permease [Planomonospora parontospora]|uniref:ABC transporter permease n=1 Tax=Planomonospora parontospora TaxID=58119 RepID=UPI001670233E|nr:ABC transporter permease [Planomonospora parontospora]GGL18676.1 ABC transporter permease [Planomonospora parontospora subsp. antibiotica]GII15531.1 ABC transporter permease [Planomonospora parontospora subsp. antibiotica]